MTSTADPAVLALRYCDRYHFTTTHNNLESGSQTCQYSDFSYDSDGQPLVLPNWDGSVYAVPQPMSFGIALVWHDLRR